jgi:8-oxo-dGTP pyrophosphatase MutT (NUDIX family)
VVLTEDRRLLVIQERHHTRRHYKLPGGALHPGEHIVDAVIREVAEETGIRTEFDSLVCFRHWHGYRYGKSDIYFVTRLVPLSFEIQMDTSEVSECLWMPVDDYLSHPAYRPGRLGRGSG